MCVDAVFSVGLLGAEQLGGQRERQALSVPRAGTGTRGRAAELASVRVCGESRNLGEAPVVRRAGARAVRVPGNARLPRIVPRISAVSDTAADIARGARPIDDFTVAFVFAYSFSRALVAARANATPTSTIPPSTPGSTSGSLCRSRRSAADPGGFSDYCASRPGRKRRNINININSRRSSRRRWRGRGANLRDWGQGQAAGQPYKRVRALEH